MPYFDHNATTPLSAGARVAWLEAQEQTWQNPGAAYRSGARARLVFDGARERLAALLGVAPARLVFTSGATEAANTALAHLAGAARAGSILFPATEHSCVRRAAERHWTGRIELIGCDAAGVVDLEVLARRLAMGNVAAVAVMAANNETGVLQPWREITALCRAAGIPYVCDAVQWLGKLPAHGLGEAAYLFGSAHKFGGPKGVGFLVAPEADRNLALLVGGGQQDGRRSGTEDGPGVTSMVAALAEAEATAGAAGAGACALRDGFERACLARLPGVRVVGAEAPRLWNTSMLILPAGEGARWVVKLDKRGCEVSTAAACSVAQGRGSAVLGALGVPESVARRALRVSSGWTTTAADWAVLQEALLEIAGEIGADPVL